MLYGKRVKELRKNIGLTQEQFGKKIGKSTQAISRIERGNPKPVKSDTLEILAESLNTTTDYLLGLSDLPKFELFEIIEDDDRTIKVPVYGKIPAGEPIEALQVDYGYVPVDKEKFRGGKRIIGLKVVGDSMYPYYMEGDIVLIEINPMPENGDDVVAFIGYDGEATLKRFHWLDNKEGLSLEPLNREYPVKKFLKGEQEVRILGKVIEIRREVWK